MKKTFLLIVPIFFLVLAFPLNPPQAFASTIFQDPMTNNVNPSYWDIISNQYNSTSEGIQDNGSGQYSTLWVKNIFYNNDNEMKVDVMPGDKFSAFNLTCRRNDNTGQIEGAFFAIHNGVTDGDILFRYFGENNYAFNWDGSPGIHHFDLICNNTTASVYEDGKLLQTHTFYANILGIYSQFEFGGAWTGVGGDATFSNFSYCDEGSCTPNITLSVPLLKQTDILWGAMEYDSAKKWAPLNPTIGDWGCALTSATMVMQYYGLKNMPDGTPLNPASVNKWLKSQSDGYVNEGWVNWLALTRLAKLAKSSGNNPGFSYDALEYKRAPFSSTTLENDLGANRPDILEEPGHFIVNTGEDNGVFSINDPYYPRTSLNSYNNSALSVGQYIPSNTNLSYIEVVLPTTIDAVIENASAQKEGSDGISNFTDITGASYYTETGITDPITNTTNTGVKFLTIPTPQDSNYTLTFYSNIDQPLNVKIFKYDINGDVTTDTLTGAIHANDPTTDTFLYQQQPTTGKADKLCQTFQEHMHNQNKIDFLCTLMYSKKNN